MFYGILQDEVFLSIRHYPQTFGFITLACTLQATVDVAELIPNLPLTPLVLALGKAKETILIIPVQIRYTE